MSMPFERQSGSMLPLGAIGIIDFVPIGVLIHGTVAVRAFCT